MLNLLSSVPACSSAYSHIFCSSQFSCLFLYILVLPFLLPTLISPAPDCANANSPMSCSCLLSYLLLLPVIMLTLLSPSPACSSAYSHTSCSCLFSCILSYFLLLPVLLPTFISPAPDCSPAYSPISCSCLLTCLLTHILLLPVLMLTLLSPAPACSPAYSPISCSCQFSCLLSYFLLLPCITSCFCYSDTAHTATHNKLLTSKGNGKSVRYILFGFPSFSRKASIILLKALAQSAFYSFFVALTLSSPRRAWALDELRTFL